MGGLLASLAHLYLALIPATLNPPKDRSDLPPQGPKMSLLSPESPSLDKEHPFQVSFQRPGLCPHQTLRLGALGFSPGEVPLLGHPWHWKAIPDLPQGPRTCRQDTNQTAFAPGQQTQAHQYATTHVIFNLPVATLKKKRDIDKINLRNAFYLIQYV